MFVEKSVARLENRRTWFYRIRPSANHDVFEPMNNVAAHLTHDWDKIPPNPNQVSRTHVYKKFSSISRQD